MKAICYREFGGSDKLEIVNDFPMPEVGDSDVLIQLKSTSVNPVDWKIREGFLKSMFPHEFPIIPGWDASGVVGKVGKDVTRFKEGDAVYAYCRRDTFQWGTYCEYISLPESYVAFKPKCLSFSEAATIPLVGLTSWQALYETAGLEKGQSVLIHAGAGGIGSLAIQLAKCAGASRIFTTASENNHDYVKSLGADVAIDYKSQNFVSVIKSEMPKGIDVVFDTLGGATQVDSFNVLKEGGFIVSIAGTPDAAIAEKYGVKTGFVFVSANSEQLERLTELFEHGKMKVPAFKELDLDQAKEGMDLSQSRHVQGKIVLKI